MRDRIAVLLASTPIFFVGVVLGVALCFRAAIGIIRPAAAEADVADVGAPAPPALVARVPEGPAVSDPSPHPHPLAEADGKATPTPPTRHKPRTHGKR